MIIALVIIFMILMLFLDRYFYHKFFTWPSIITIIWCITLSFALMGLYDTVIPSITTVLYTMFFILSLNLASIIFSKKLIKNEITKNEKANYNISINDKLLTFIEILCLILLIIICRKGIVIFLSTFNMSAVRNAYINYESIGVHMQVLFTITVVPIGKAVYVLSIIDYVHNKKIKLPLILSTVFAVLCMLLTGGRGILVFLLFTFVVSLILKEKNIFDIIKNNKKIVKLCAFIVLIILLVTLQRGFGKNGMFTTIYVYFCGCFNLFEVYLRQGFVYPGGLLFGQALISGISFPFIEILRYVFHVNILPGNYILANEAVAQYIRISPTIAINATPTTMFTAIRDFGVAGLLIYPTVISYIYYKLKELYQKNNSIISEAFLVNFITSSLLLNMSYQFGSFQTLSAFLYMIIIYKISNSEKLIKILKYPSIILVKLDNLNIIRLSDEKYLKIIYKSFFNKKLDLNDPKTFNEKLQWLKLYDRKDIYTKMVDKYEAKEYISSIIGKEYVIPTLGIYDSFDEIDFSKLPNQFTIKCTHDSGSVIVCKDKKSFSLTIARKKIEKCLKKNYYYTNREWPYKNIKPRIIIEKYLENNNKLPLCDYKFFCFQGSPKYMYISTGLENHATASMSFFDMDYNAVTLKRADYKALDNVPPRPKNYEKMKKFAKVLSKNLPHLRVDFYEIDGQLFVGELTFTTNGGFIPFEEEKWDIKLGDLIKLPEKK